MKQSILDKAHKAARYNRKALELDNRCGCFYCLKVYSPTKIVEWIPKDNADEEVTAICPYCGIDAVLPESAGFPLEQDFLKQMCVRWFSATDEKGARMGKIQYTDDKMQRIHGRVRRLSKIVNELETDFPGRHFTLDGHLVGSIGEVVAAYHYGITLYNASSPIHDGEIGKRKVQIKVTQQNNIVINHEPDYLIVLFMNRKGNFYEVYNGPGKEPWDSASKRDSHNNRHMLVSKLMKLDKKVDGRRRIRQKHPIEKMKKEYISR